ncbi:MAG: precorrin-6y C5,15-methyltransferase (decarboxylating) subunit CbiE [Myxococcaceae bacterium]
MAIAERAIAIVGAGPGSPDQLTPAARRVVERAEVLVGAQRLLDLFPAVEAERVPVGADIEMALAAIAARAGRRIAVLVSGDPGLCSLARPVLRRFGRDACEVVPGISSLQVAFARVGLDWQDARIIDAHGRVPEIAPEALEVEAKVALLVGHRGAQPWLGELARALSAGRRIFACENLTLENERVREIGPAEVAALASSSRTIILLISKELVP